MTRRMAPSMSYPVDGFPQGLPRRQAEVDGRLVGLVEPLIAVATAGAPRDRPRNGLIGTRHRG